MPKTKPTVDMIVPVFNEGKTLAKVLKTLLATKLFAQIICVNDGSTDNSLTILKSFGNKIVLVNCPKNKGKANALAEGLKKVTAPIVSFTDADITGMTKTHLRAMIEPLIKDEADIVIGNKDDILLKTMPKIGAALSGQRTYWMKDLKPLINKIRRKRFGIEVFLNETFRNKRTKVITLHGLNHLYKHQKFEGLDLILKEYSKELQEMGKELYKLNSKKMKDKLKQSPQYKRVKKIQKLLKEEFDLKDLI